MSRHAVIQVDRDGRVIAWNADAEAMFGHSSAAVIGRPVDVIIPERWRNAHWAGFHRAMTAPAIKDMAADLPVLCADGKERHFPARLLALSDGLGHAIGAMAIYADEGTTGVHPFD